METRLGFRDLPSELTIIIVNWNSREHLERCLLSIRETAEPQKVEVVVVDNNSQDGSTEMVRKDFPEYTLFDSGGNIGFGRANNLGLCSCATPYVLFLNPDTVVLPGAFDAMTDFLKLNSDV